MKYFGTDGVRGRVGQWPMTPEFVLHFGWAVGSVLAERGVTRRVVIGKDTRISGYLFESALEAGLSAAGADSILLGPMPTPAVAHLTHSLGASAGIVISASHNPYHDNGLKCFSSAGEKLEDDWQVEIEAAIDRAIEQGMVMADSPALGKALRVDDAVGRYIEFCKATVGSQTLFNGMKFVLDCANGATYRIAPEVFRELGAEVITLHASPNGLNINEACGSTHPESLATAVVEHGADLGMAFDGDGDRVIMVDEGGDIIDGDQILYVLAQHRLQRGQSVDGIVGTVMSNLGLEQALNELGIAFDRASVGDRHVHERLRDRQWALGGEASGHILALDRSPTGCGIVSALQVCEVIQASKRSLGEWVSGMMKYPQVMINVPTSTRVTAESLKAVPLMDAIRQAESELGEQGRVVLRPSGTEPVVRVMVEGREHNEVQRLTERLAEVVSAVL